MGSLFLISAITLCVTISCNVLAAPETCSDLSSSVYQNREAFKAAVNDDFDSDLKGFYIKRGVRNNIVNSPTNHLMTSLMRVFGSGRELQQETLTDNRFSKNETLVQAALGCVVDSFDNRHQIKFANTIFFDVSLKLKPKYKKMVKSVFRTRVQKVDFKEAPAAARAINDWFAKITNKRARTLLEPAELGGNSSLLFVSAAYFEAHWKSLFNPTDTHKKLFYRYGADPKHVPMMYKSHVYRHGALPEAQAEFVEIPLKSRSSSDASSMFIIRPNELNNVDSWRSKLRNVNLDMLLSRGKKANIELYLPKFKIGKTVKLAPWITADFSSVFYPLQPVETVKYFQNIFLEINEDGGKAAAVSGSQKPLKGNSAEIKTQSQLKFIVDRPFVCVIATKGGLALFDALILDPSEVNQRLSLSF